MAAKTHSWEVSAQIPIERAYHTATLVPGLQPYLLAIGGRNGSDYLNSIEEYDVGLEYQRGWQSTITNYPAVTPISAGMNLTGTLFRDITEADGGNNCHVVSNDHPIISLVRVGGGNWQGNGGGEIMYVPSSHFWDETHTNIDLPDTPSGYYRLWSIVNGIPCKWYEKCFEVEETQSSNLKPQVSVYPNPATSAGVEFNFSTYSPQSLTLKIYDIAGKLIKEIQQVHTSKLKMNGLKPGIYFYRAIYNKDSQSLGKFIIVK
jgi:hypothetical protein